MLLSSIINATIAYPMYTWVVTATPKHVVTLKKTEINRMLKRHIYSKHDHLVSKNCFRFPWCMVCNCFCYAPPSVTFIMTDDWVVRKMCVGAGHNTEHQSLVSLSSGTRNKDYPVQPTDKMHGWTFLAIFLIHHFFFLFCTEQCEMPLDQQIKPKKVKLCIVQSARFFTSMFVVCK